MPRFASRSVRNAPMNAASRSGSVRTDGDPQPHQRNMNSSRTCPRRRRRWRLTLRWRMRRLVKKRSINVATLQTDFGVTSHRRSRRRAASSINRQPRDTSNILHGGVVEVSREHWRADVLPPRYQSSSVRWRMVTEVVHAWPGTITCGAAARSPTPPEDAINVLVHRGLLFGNEEGRPTA